MEYAGQEKRLNLPKGDATRKAVDDESEGPQDRTRRGGLTPGL